MSVITCGKIRDGRSASVKGGTSEERKEFTDVYRVITNSVNDDQKTIIDYFRANGPFLKSRHPADNNAICVALTPNNEQGVKWTVNVEYKPEDSESNEEKPNSSGDKTSDPEQWLEIEAGSYTDTVPVYQAIFRDGIDALADGQLVVPMNAAGQPFSPPLEKEITIGTLRITRWRLYWLANKLRGFENKVNNAQFTLQLQTYEDNWPPYTAKIKSVGGSYRLVNNDFWWRTTTEVHIHPETFRAVVANIGTCAKAEAGDPDGKGGTFSAAALKVAVPRVRKLVDPNGKSVQAPCFLDSKGQPIKEGDMPTWITYSIYEEIDFQTAQAFGLL